MGIQEENAAQCDPTFGGTVGRKHDTRKDLPNFGRDTGEHVVQDFTSFEY